MTMSDKYYYQEGAIHNDQKQVMNVSLSGKVDVGALIKGFFTKDATDAEVLETGVSEESAMPDVLCTPDAEALFAKLKEAGIMDDRWQPISLSNAEKGTLVEYIAEKLDIRNKWKLFGMLWKTDSETLRTAKARGLDQEKTWEFRNKLDNL